MKLKWKYFNAAVLYFTIAVSVIALLPRVNVEKLNNTVGIIVDYRDVVMLAQNSKMSTPEVLKYLVSCGVSGLMVSELTGEEFSSGNLPIFYGNASDNAQTLTSGQKGSIMIIPSDVPYAEEFIKFMELRFNGKRLNSPQGLGVVLPFTMWHMEKFGIAPDLEGLHEADRLGLPVMWRVAPSLNGETRDSLEMLAGILEKYKNIKVVSPVGDMALGFPNMSQLGVVLKKYNIPVAQVEFSRQLGATQLESFLFPNIIPLHSVTQEEMTSRNLTRVALYERLIRAVTERSVRLLVFRPAISGSNDNPVEQFGDEIKMLKDGLSGRGMIIGMPENVFINKTWGKSAFGAIACSVLFLYALFRFYFRFNAMEIVEDRIKIYQISIFAALCVLLSLAVVYSSGAAIWIGAFTSVFVVVEASLIALNSWQKPIRSALSGFIFAVIGGLAIAAFFSDPAYMLRLRAFSGVKLTLMLPPIFVLLYDMHRRIHPESLRDILSRPPLWGELILFGVLLAGAGIILFRSDNVKVVPGFEAKMREYLERVLIARPRNKEIMLGFPCLLLYCYVMYKGLWVKYREILRLGVVIGFSSVVNSFCHFHTPLFFTLIRQLNGLWLGLLVGVFAVAVLHFVVLPVYKRFKIVID